MKKITAKHIRQFEMAIKKWTLAGTGLAKDAQMTDLYRQDREALREVLTAIKFGDYQKGGQLACDLDTIVRDQIPCEIWKALP